MKLILLGVIELLAHPHLSIAVFSGEPGASINAHRGDMLEGFTVEEIVDRRVIVTRKNRRLVLRPGDALDESSTETVHITTGLEMVGHEIRISQVLRDHVASAGLVPIIMSACSDRVVDAAGETIGYRIFEIDPGSAFELIGLRNDDIVTELDGAELTTPLKAMRALNAIRDKQSFSFSFTRAGVEQRRSVIIR